MDGAPEKTLATHLGKSGVAPDVVRDFFTRMGLPLPRFKEYFTTSDNGAIVFLNSCGLAIRLCATGISLSAKDEPYRLEPVNHPAVLQPLASFRMGALYAEILPGVKLGWNRGDALDLKALLEKDGITFSDPRLGNFGYLPAHSATQHKEVPVVVDRNSVHYSSSSGGNPLAVEESAQDRLYASLRQECARCWEQGNMSPFWRKSEEACREGLLTAGWNVPEFADILHYHLHGETTRAQRVSRRYEERLERYAREKGLDFPLCASSLSRG